MAVHLLEWSPPGQQCWGLGLLLLWRFSLPLKTRLPSVSSSGRTSLALWSLIPQLSPSAVRFLPFL